MKRRVMASVVLLVTLAACGGPQPDDQLTGSIDSATWEHARTLPPGVREALDAGTAAFRDRDLQAARTHYLRAVELGPNQSPAWFGLAMVERQLGNIAAADSAMMRVQALAPEASLITTDSGAVLPPNHP